MATKPNILLIYTGGTIGMIKDFATGALKAFDFDKLLSNIPELTQLACAIKTFSFASPIDSSNMAVDHWVQLAKIIEHKYDQFDGFVILHGSDTMAYSASALSFMLENLAKPVVFTGSQLPIGDLRTDAKENLITAIQIAAMQHKNAAVIQEVCLYFEYKLYRGNRTTKINAEHFNAFLSPNYPALAESGVHLKVSEELLLPHPVKKLLVHTEFDSNVMIVKLFPGLNEFVFKSLLDIPNLKGLVLETYGSGNAPSATWFIAALQAAIKKGLQVVNVTQCAGGNVRMGDYETSTQLKKIGVISGNDITTEAAITKLMYLLGQQVDSAVFKSIFETPLRGEIS